MTQLTLETLEEMTNEVKSLSVDFIDYVFVKSDETETLTEQEVYNIVEQQLRDLECNRHNYQLLTDEEWEDMHESVWELICEVCFDDEEFIPENLQELQ